MTDFDQSGEELDENLSSDYPPDRPTGVYDEEATGVPDPSTSGDEWGDNADATRPEAWEAGPGEGEGAPTSGGGTKGPVLAGDEDVGAADEEKDLVAPPDEPDRRGHLASDDEFSGDETTRDVATEHVPSASEEDAVRYDETPPGATG